MLRGTGVAGTAAITGGSIGTGTTGLPTVLAQSWVPVSAPADTSEDTFATITVPANTLGANGALRVTAIFSMTNSANTKTIRIRYSGSSGTQYLNQAWGSGAASVYVQQIIANRGATNSQVGPRASSNPWTTDAALVVTSSVDTTASTTLVITGQKALGSETLTLEGYLVEVIH